jgi:transcriptional regulator with XRE-family HTH domain
LLHALRLSKDFARERHNLSVERIADRMGIGADLLYKWLANGRLPAILIPNYETVCGCHFVSQWLAMSAGKLVIDIPAGRNAGARDVHRLQGLLNDAAGQIIKFAEGASDAATTLAAILAGMAGLAWHKTNIEKHVQPELAFTEE